MLAVVVAGLAPVAAAGAVAAGDQAAESSGARAAKGAVKLVTPRGKPLRGRWQGWADRALVPTVTGRVRVRVRRCPARPKTAGCVYTRRPRTIYVRPRLRDPRGVLLHELGHVFDYRQLSAADRARLAVLLRAPVWGDQQQPTIGSEKFADAYALCGLGLSLRRGWIVDEYVPRSMRQHRAVCRAITQSAN